MTALTDMDYNILSDLFKDVHGFRPRGLFAEMTVEEYDAEFASLQKQLEENQVAEKRAHELATIAWRERMETLARELNATFEQVVRWDAEAYNCSDDLGYYEYQVGLSYGTLNEFGITQKD